MVRISRFLLLVGSVFALLVLLVVLWPGDQAAEPPTTEREPLEVMPAPSARAQLMAVEATPDEWVVASAAALAPEPESVPELTESDTMVRRMAAGLSARSELASWLVTKGLIRRFVAATQAVAGGYSPREEVAFLKPTGTFLVQRREVGLVIAPSTFRRYDSVAEVFASLDSEGLLRLYERLEPLIEEAYGELPWTRGEFGDVLLGAMDHLLATPVPPGLPAVERGTLHYVYADDSLERLSDAQRHLLRMGPRNARAIQMKLAELHRLFAPDEPIVCPTPMERGAWAGSERTVAARCEVERADESAISTSP